jgi:hypothetical protein
VEEAVDIDLLEPALGDSGGQGLRSPMFIADISTSASCTPSTHSSVSTFEVEYCE